MKNWPPEVDPASVPYAEWPPAWRWHRRKRIFLDRIHGVEAAVRDRLAPSRTVPRLFRPERIVFVCKGNICRSAFAEAYYRQIDPDVEVTSVGVDVLRSSSPNELAIEAGASLGVDTSGHRSRPLGSVVDSPGTLYLVMEPWQGRPRALARARREGRILRLGHWSSPRRAVVPDPLGRNPEDYRECFASIRSMVDAFRRSIPTAPSIEHTGRIKRHLLALLTSPPARTLFLPWTRHRVPIIMLHRFATEERGDRTSVALLERCLRFLRDERMAVLSLSDLCTSLARGEVPSRGVVFTVDDGYLDFKELAFPLFRRYEVPVTVFVASGFIDGALWYWWDKVRYVIERSSTRRLEVDLGCAGGLELAWDTDRSRRVARRTLVEALKTVPLATKLAVVEDVQRRLGVEVPPIPPPEYRGMTWQDVRALGDQGVEFGAHTVTHPILSRAPAERQRVEVVESLASIERNTGRRATTFCYPNGRLEDLGVADEILLRQPGVDGAVMQEPAIVSKQTLRAGRAARVRLPRMAMPPTFEQFVGLVCGIGAIRLALRREPWGRKDTTRDEN